VSAPASYRVRVGELELDVTIDDQSGRVIAVVGDERWTVDLAAHGTGAYTLRVDASRCEVLLAPAADGYWVALDGYQDRAEVVEARALRLAAALPARATQRGREEVRAPMPGRVVAIRAEVGSEVERGTVVAILEAMKMENELRAPHAGRVAAVRVGEGDRVELGAVLLVLEPPSDAEPAGNSDSG
jgi:biotin carboxyl carrier protein